MPMLKSLRMSNLWWKCLVAALWCRNVMMTVAPSIVSDSDCRRSDDDVADDDGGCDDDGTLI